MTDHESIRDKLLKIKALVDRGVDGEAIAAQHQLERLMAKHGFTLEDLASEDRKIVRFLYKKGPELKLLVQILAKVLDVKRLPDCDIYESCLDIKLTPSQSVDAKDMFDHYLREMRAEIKAMAKRRRHLLDALIHRHQIYPATPSGDGKTWEEMTAREKAKYRELLQVMESLRTKAFRKPAGYIA